MELKDLMTALDRIVVNNAGRDIGKSKVGVVVHRPGALGGTPCNWIEGVDYVEVNRVDKGFDWDSKKIMLTLKQDISLLTPDERDAITKDHSRSTSREGYDQFKQFRARIAALEAALIQVGHGLQRNLDEQRCPGESAIQQEEWIEVIKALEIKGY
jgi:hypothetical protein